jgi:DNA-binding NtrC family response regulator
MAISDQIESIGKRDCAVIIKGETGTAKETLARQIHLHSPRAASPFVPVNCGTLRGKILQNQLFGQVSILADGKQTVSLGAFRSADHGTVFLDEIDKLTIDTQARIFHVLQHRTIQPADATEHFPVNVRIICATDQELRLMVQQSLFMSDLYFKLNVATLELPPLRQRPDDIIILAKYFLDLHAQMYNEPVKELEDAAVKVLTRYTWPGNVRELAGIMERAFVMSQSNKITVNDLPSEIITSDVLPEKEEEKSFPALDDVDRKLIMRALEKTRGQKMAASKLLKIDHRKLNRLIKKFDLEPNSFK